MKNKKSKKNKNKNPEFHGDMSNVPTTKKDDGYRHMKASPNQWSLAGWEHDPMFDGKSFSQIVEESRRRQPADREEISWIENTTRNIVLGVSESLSYRIHCKQMTTPGAIGRLFYVWWESDLGWKTHEWGFLSLTEAMDYCQEKLSPAKRVVRTKFNEGDVRGIGLAELRVAARQLKEGKA